MRTPGSIFSFAWPTLEMPAQYRPVSPAAHAALFTVRAIAVCTSPGPKKCSRPRRVALWPNPMPVPTAVMPAVTAIVLCRFNESLSKSSVKKSCRSWRNLRDL